MTAVDLFVLGWLGLMAILAGIGYVIVASGARADREMRKRFREYQQEKEPGK